MELWELIKKVRGKRSMAKFGEALGVSKQCIYQWEHELREPSKQMLDKMGIQRQFAIEDDPPF